MPELPEVETIRRDLQGVLPGVRVTSVIVHLPKMVKLPVAAFRRRTIGSTVTAVHRRAKLLLIHLSSGWTIIIHLKMSGQLIWVPNRGRVRVGGHPIPGGLDDLPNKYSHVIFQTDHGVLYFNDQRQFGFLRMIPSLELDGWLRQEGYGPEPLDDSFTVRDFIAILDQHRQKRLKAALLDQTVIAGVGNIYADEACFAAKVRPSRRIASLTMLEKSGLYRGLRAVMNLSLKKRGTTARSYRTANGSKGSMMPFLKVYGRGGEPCRRCGGTIKKVVLVGRGTHYCPDCQR